MTADEGPLLVTLGMFIIDEFEFLDVDGKPTGKVQDAEIGGGGTYCTVAARMWLPPLRVGMIVDRGRSFPEKFQRILDTYGPIFQYRDDPDRETTRAVNRYRGDYRGFQYLTPRVRISPKDLVGTPLACPKMLHLICSPSRAKEIIGELRKLKWEPLLIYEPIPDRCVPEELPALRDVIPSLHILSPNAEEALSFFSIPDPPTTSLIEKVAHDLFYACGEHSTPTAVIIRSGELGAVVYLPNSKPRWIPPCLRDGHPVVDVTGAGNAFLGGLAAGLELANGDINEAVLYASVSAGFTIEQTGLPPARPDWDVEAKKRLEAFRTAIIGQRL